ncbi:MAG: chemotaxis protein CheW [Bdellovibrionales bacterium]|nr:chemotaxis protein CheW [Bdellovibrionales bacterium]
MSTKHLLFRIESRYFAIKLIFVKEVILHREIEAIPKSSPDIKGIFNLRGQVIPVIDFSRILRVPGPEAKKPNMVVLESEASSKDFGFQVDEVIEVIRIEEDQLNHQIDSDKNLAHFTYAVLADHAQHPDKIIYVLKDELSIGEVETAASELEQAS